MARRAASEHRRLSAILSIMKRSEIAPAAHVKRLGQALSQMHGADKFMQLQSMGEITAEHIRHVLDMPDLKY
jgi:hypothetical protein